MADRYRSIARVTKTHGRNGEVVVVPTHGLPFLLEEGMRVALVPPALREERFFIVRRASEGPSGALVALAGVGTLDAACGLVGRTVLAREADLPDDLTLLDLERLMGREVCDRRLGPLGAIVDAMVGPANDIWVVEGPFGEVLVPVVDEFVVGAAEEGPIAVDLPDGIVDAPAPDSRRAAPDGAAPGDDVLGGAAPDGATAASVAGMAGEGA